MESFTMNPKSKSRIAYLCHLACVVLTALFVWQIYVNGWEVLMMSIFFWVPFGIALMTAIVLSLGLRTRTLFILNVLAVGWAAILFATESFGFSSVGRLLWYVFHFVYVYLTLAPAAILYGWRDWY